MNRRRFLTTSGAMLTPASWAALTPGSVRTVSVFHTTDLHGHILPTKSYEGLVDVGGLARCATVIRQWRAESPHHLLVDVGDLYQGTEVGRGSRGQAMVKVLNALNYDAWVLGNHDFDWGRDVLDAAIANAACPVLAGNIRFGGRAAGQQEKTSPLARLAPHLLREIGGIKIGIVGAVTPGLSSWLAPHLLREVEAFDPLESVRASVAELKASGAQAIIVAGHMGLRNPDFLRDDFANRVSDLTQRVPDVDVFIGGHTHQDIPAARAHRVPYSQAGYHGIHLGRLDLSFHVESGKLLSVRPFTELMDNRHALDPGVLALARDELVLADAELDMPVGRVVGHLSARSAAGAPSQQERLIAQAITEALATRNVRVAGVLHGSFFNDDLLPGPKSVSDMWDLMPYENGVVTASLDRSELVTVLEEAFAHERNTRNLMGFTVRTNGMRKNPKVTALLDAAGQPFEADRRHLIAFNSYDAQSAGQRLPRLREILSQPAAGLAMHPIETRQAMIEFFQRHATVSATSLGDASRQGTPAAERISGRIKIIPQLAAS